MFNWIKKLRIPHGMYCYKPLKIIRGDEFGFRIKTRECPFYERKGDDPLYGWCSLEECEITDQCKLCSYNDFTDKELEEMKYGNV